MNKIVWEDIDRKNLFTVRSAAMVDLSKSKIIQHYLANTKIQVTQKANYNGVTYYRTETAKLKGLDWAFRASAFGLPNEIAPSVHSIVKSDSLSHPIYSKKPKKTAHASVKKQTSTKKVISPKDGGGRRHKGWLEKLFGRKKWLGK